jgi:ADP-ribose pyrophosphatase YjhB (NUDIX family)
MPETPAPVPPILRWASEIRGQASALLHYSTNDYDRERARRLIAIAGEMTAGALDLPSAEVVATFEKQLDYLTPLSTADAAVFDTQGRILLIQRHDNQLWAMPGGACDFEETGAQAAVRELHEEVGVRGEALALLGVWDSRIHLSRSPLHHYSQVYLCRIIDGAPGISSEALAVDYFAPDTLPPLSPGHVTRVPIVCDIYRQWRTTGYFTPFFDR